jgi:beta-lactam-binding protein with PASTA domain
MPDLIGLPAGPAAEALQGAGLRIADVINRAYPGAAPGTVLKQTPLPGFRVGPRTPVYLEVSAES